MKVKCPWCKRVLRIPEDGHLYSVNRCYEQKHEFNQD